MQTADFNHNDFSNEGTSEADKQLLVKFEKVPMEDKVESAKEGRPIFKDIVMIDIRIPGQRDSIVRRKATYADEQRFPEHLRLFKLRVDGAEAEAEKGTPLSTYPAIPRRLVEEMAFFNVTTVEHLANISDTHIDKFPGGQNMKRAAQEWLARAENDGSVNELKAELASKDARLVKLEAQIEKLLAREEEQDEEPAPKKKRRPKATTE